MRITSKGHVTIPMRSANGRASSRAPRSSSASRAIVRIAQSTELPGRGEAIVACLRDVRRMASRPMRSWLSRVHQYTCFESHGRLERAPRHPHRGPAWFEWSSARSPRPQITAISRSTRSSMRRSRSSSRTSRTSIRTAARELSPSPAPVAGCVFSRASVPSPTVAPVARGDLPFQTLHRSPRSARRNDAADTRRGSLPHLPSTAERHRARPPIARLRPTPPVQRRDPRPPPATPPASSPRTARHRRLEQALRVRLAREGRHPGQTVVPAGLRPLAGQLADRSRTHSASARLVGAALHEHDQLLAAERAARSAPRVSRAARTQHPRKLVAGTYRSGR